MKDLQEIIKTLCKYNVVEIIEVHMMSDYVYLLLKKCIRFYEILERKEYTDNV